MTARDVAAPSHWTWVGGELRKLPAFARRDLRIILSYRFPFVADIFSLAFQTVTFYFVGRLVDPSKLPAFNGDRPSYLGFVVVGIAVTAFLQLGLSRVVRGIQVEQAIGTLESVLATPTGFTTLQIGSAVYDIIYVPLRTAIFLAIVATTAGVSYEASGLIPAALLLLAFIPLIWGVGILLAALVVTFRRGQSLIGFATSILSLASGAFFPLTLLPGAFQWLAKGNPVAITLDGMRAALLGGAGFGDVAWRLAVLSGLAVVTISAGALAFRAAVRRERRLGTIGLY
jgi:ABC-2 type transport system permease protein